MAKDRCIDRLEQTLKRSSISSAKAEDIIQSIKDAQKEVRLDNLDNELSEQVAKKILKEQQITKKIKERNALENEIKIRSTVEYVLREFPNNPAEGLTAVLVGSNLQRVGSRASVALAQLSEYRMLVSGFQEKLRQNNLVELFAEANEDIDRRTARTIWEIGSDKPITEKNESIVNMARIMSEFSESVRKKLNNLGANIDRLPGWIVRQTHDPMQIRNAADVLKLKDNKNVAEFNGSIERNFNAWKEYIMPKLDERTFDGFDTKDEFFLFTYNSLVRNGHVLAEGSSGVFGSKDLTTKLAAKRVLHFKTSDDWFDYNSKFGSGNLRESFFYGLNSAGRNIGMITTLGTKPKENFQLIKSSIAKQLTKEKKLKYVDDISNNNSTYDYQFAEIDGSVNMIGHSGGAKWSAITRSILSMAKLGGAVVSAMADIHLYAKELSYQGRTYLGGVAEAMGNLAKIKNTARKQEIAEQLGFMADNLIYDLAARYSVGDNLSRNFTKLQRTFFKLNLLNWWTNSLKEGAMLGMSNYVAKQRGIEFGKLETGFKRLITHFGIDEKLWNTIRKLDVEKADDGKEFFSVRNIDNLSKKQILDLMNLKTASQRQIDLYRDTLKSKVSGMFLDRSGYAVIEPDARTRAFMKRGLTAGTVPGEAWRFFFQFKAFPLAVLQKAFGREMSFIRDGQNAKGLFGMANLVVGAGIFGYIAMTAKDLLKGKSPKDPAKLDTFYAAMLQGGGLGIYGDFLFSKTRSGSEIMATAAGPFVTEAFNALQAIKYGIRGEKDPALKQAYKSVVGNIPFLNLFYAKTAFDYAIGYQIMETLSPGYLREMERKMKKDSGQEFLFTKPSVLFKGF
jgi:hypothetical protein